ncbi:hypothetical protein TL16_g11649 [Triparma laevis f. inornata]|uniref:Uncharacterized protein n=2 Tax=Triparma laevis TaxID=1534972 RepID=A0A9W6ZM24_9STRA|nr:hypothetical protein TrLO_g735 [Triparma laevis f. longispina]GMH90049.1 hypothetical protein TL16_g11649 [Triparma laevis f. inornata]
MRVAIHCSSEPGYNWFAATIVKVQKLPLYQGDVKVLVKWDGADVTLETLVDPVCAPLGEEPQEASSHVGITYIYDGTFDISHSIHGFTANPGDSFVGESMVGGCNEQISVLCPLLGPPPEQGQKTLWFVYYYDWNVGMCPDPSSHRVTCCYTTRAAALEALRLPHSTEQHLPDEDNEVESSVKPPPINSSRQTNGKFVCHEYQVSGY